MFKRTFYREFPFFFAGWLIVHTFLLVNYQIFWVYSLAATYFMLIVLLRMMSRKALLKIKVEDFSLLPYYQAKEKTPVTDGGDAGLDLPCPQDMVFPPGEIVKIPLGISCETTYPYVSGYYLYPRSSISKTPLIQVNSVGIIDSSYRGQLTGVVRNLSDEPYEIKAGTRLFQLCLPSLRSFKIKLAETLTETERGRGGFGSTG